MKNSHRRIYLSAQHLIGFCNAVQFWLKLDAGDDVWALASLLCVLITASWFIPPKDAK